MIALLKDSRSYFEGIFNEIDSGLIILEPLVRNEMNSLFNKEEPAVNMSVDISAYEEEGDCVEHTTEDIDEKNLRLVLSYFRMNISYHVLFYDE